MTRPDEHPTLNWTFDGESHHADRYRIDPTLGGPDRAMHHIYVDGEYSSSCPGLNRAKGWCVLHARHLDANGFSDREWLKLAAAALLLIVGIAVWGWM